MKSITEHINEAKQINESVYKFITSEILTTLTNEFNANNKLIDNLDNVLSKLRKINSNLVLRQVRSAIDQIDVTISIKQKSGKYSVFATIIDADPLVIFIEDYENLSTWSSNEKDLAKIIIDEFKLKPTNKYAGEFSTK